MLCRMQACVKHTIRCDANLGVSCSHTRKGFACEDGTHAVCTNNMPCSRMQTVMRLGMYNKTDAPDVKFIQNVPPNFNQNSK